jgi:hypothetical protein
MVAGDTIVVHRITLNATEARPPESGNDGERVVVRDPYPEARVDSASFLDHAFGGRANAPAQGLRDKYGEVLQRTTAHMFHAPQDLIVWTLTLLASRQADLALAAGDACVETAPSFHMGHLVRGLALGDLGRVDEARTEIDRAFTGNPFLRKIFAPVTSVLLNGGTREELRAEVQKLEDMGVFWFTPALWTIYRNRFTPGAEPLPMGIIVPRDQHYQSWMRYFGEHSRRIMPVNSRAAAQLNFISVLKQTQGN